MPQLQARPPLALCAAALIVIAMAASGPIAQPALYHHFADQRTLWGIPNFFDVVSNLGFLVVGSWGLAQMIWSDRRDAAHAPFFAAILMTGLGSAWYHLAPDDLRLVWDRVPIALACAAILAAAARAAYPGVRTLLALTLFGLGSVYWWTLTGDLRPYLLIQLAPLVLIPLLQWQGRTPAKQRVAFGIAIALYVLAKLFELGDAVALARLHLLSGHTIKHILATLAAVMVAYAIAPVPNDE